MSPKKPCSTSLCHPALELSHWDIPLSLWGFCHKQLAQRKLKVCYCRKCREWKVKIAQTKAQRWKDSHGHQHTKNSLPVSPTSTCYHLAYSPEVLMKKCVTFLTYRRFFTSSPDPAADLSYCSVQEEPRGKAEFNLSLGFHWKWGIIAQAAKQRILYWVSKHIISSLNLLSVVLLCILPCPPYCWNAAISV